MPISQRKLQANRLNAQKSTGPRTPEGKAVCSLNALTHGLRARKAVMVIEDRQAFDALCQELHEQWQPLTPSEIHMVEQMAVSRWKSARMENLVSSMNLQSAFIHLSFQDIARHRNKKGNVIVPDLVRNEPEIRMLRLLDAVQRHIMSLERSYRQAMQTLMQLQELRRQKQERFEQAKQADEAREQAIEKVMAAGAGAPFSYDVEARSQSKPASKVTRYGETWTRPDTA